MDNLVGFYFVITFFKVSTLVNSFNAKAQSAIFPTKSLLGLDLISLLFASFWSMVTNTNA